MPGDDYVTMTLIFADKQGMVSGFSGRANTVAEAMKQFEQWMIREIDVVGQNFGSATFVLNRRMSG